MLEPVSLMPHAVCWASAPKLIWTMVITNMITFLSYLTICFTLLYLTRRTRRVFARDWAYFVVGFALFIVACGLTHLLEVVTTWLPVFWIDAWVNVITAALSAYVAVMLLRRIGTIAFSISDYADRLAATEDQRLHLQESLVAAQKLEEWSRLSATLSHEIRGPLESIQNCQYLIRTSQDVSPDVAHLAQSAADEAHRVLALAKTMLSFMRQGAERERVDICATLESVRVLLEPLISERQIDFRIEVEGDCIVESYAGETRQVLLNLVRNACESVARIHARVTVTARGEDDRVEIVVADQGTGISPNLLPNLFEFGVTTKGERGNGMGLWTVKRIIDRHGGEVRVRSAMGQGTEFALTWPRSVAVGH